MNMKPNYNQTTLIHGLQSENQYLKATIRDMMNTKGIMEAALSGTSTRPDLTPEQAARLAIEIASQFAKLLSIEEEPSTSTQTNKTPQDLSPPT